MWPNDFHAWFETVGDLAATDLMFWLGTFPVLHSVREILLERGLRRTARVAVGLWRRGRRVPYAFADRRDFCRWFVLESRRACLKHVLEVEPVVACISQLPADTQRLLTWLYVHQMSYQEIAGPGVSPDGTRRLCVQAYRDLRSALACRWGEHREAFPLYPAAAGFPLSTR